MNWSDYSEFVRDAIVFGGTFVGCISGLVLARAFISWVGKLK